MRKIISYLLVATITVSLLAACGAKKEEVKDVTGQSESSSGETVESEEEQKKETGTIQLNKIGSFSDDNLKVTISNGGLLSGDEEVSILDYLGNDNLGKTYASATCLFDGYWVVNNGKSDINSNGLVSIDGTELIPCEAAWISNELWTQGSTDESRFISVFYSTGETTNKDEAIFYSSDMSTILFGSAETENSVFYTGYGKVFDLEEEKFVEGIEITVDNLKVYACGDGIIEIKDDATYLYDADGNIKNEFEKISSTDIDSVNGYFVVNSDNESILYDCEGNEVMKSSMDEYQYNISTSDSNSEYVEVFKNGKYGLSDLDGNLVLPIEYKNIYDTRNEYASVENADSSYQLISLETGLPVGPTTNSLYHYIDYGYWYVKSEGENYVYINDEGEVFEDLPYASGLCIRKGEYDEGYKYYIWKDRDYSFECSSGNSLATGLIWAQNEEGLKGAFEIFTGEMLLDYEYSRMSAQDGYIYAYKDGVYDVYEIVNE